MSARLDDFRLTLGSSEYVPIMVGGMGVDISTAELALEACRLGGIGHISDAMAPFVSDRYFSTKYTKAKSLKNRASRDGIDKTSVRFDYEQLYEAQRRYVAHTMERKRGPGAIHINVMEKLQMGAPSETLSTRLKAALDGGIDGVTLSAGLHIGSLKLIKDNPRFHEVKIGIIVSSLRALKIFLRSGKRLDRKPDYVIVEGPLAGGHLGFGEDWQEYHLKDIVKEIIDFVREENLDIAVIPAGGVFTGTDAVEMMQLGAGGVQVATRFTVTEECGLPKKVKQAYFEATEDMVDVSSVSATGYLMRLLKNSPALGSNIKPQCEPLGYTLDKTGNCPYITAWDNTPVDEAGKKLPVTDKICICYHFSKHNVWTCGHYVYRLKDTSHQLPDGSYQLLTAEHVFNDYLYSTDHKISLPKQELAASA
jgi:NAD(P)H-dependent flavin oxidoreductase YrpB (nitropropane dioxygenase family)